MTINNWGLTILVRLFKTRLLQTAVVSVCLLSGVRAADQLPILVSAARATDVSAAVSTAARTRLSEFTHSNAAGDKAALAQFALGMVEYERADYVAAARDLAGLSARLPKLADYIVFYRASAQSQLNDSAGAGASLKGDSLWDRPLSPLKSRALLLRADSLTKSNHPGEAADLLRANYNALPQPSTDLYLAQAYDARKEALQAAAFYQRVFYAYPATPSAAAAATALDRLKLSLGKNFPLPSADQLVDRPSKWIEAHQYVKAKQELQTALGQLTGLDREHAQVRMGLADLRAGNAAAAMKYLKGLNLPHNDAASERDEYLVECGRRVGDDATVARALEDLAKHDPKSLWRLKALLNAANKYLVDHQPEKYEPLYRAAFENFPSDTTTALSHWRIAWDAYIARQPDAANLMREQVARYPLDTKASSAMYFLGRLAEDKRDWPAARAWFERVVQVYPHYYYALLAQDRLAQKTLAAATASSEISAWLSTVGFPVVHRFGETPDSVTSLRIERSRLLRSAGYGDWADSELRFGARNGAEPHLIAMELASSAESPFESLRMMKATVQDYLSLGFDAAPTRFWQMLFPIPFRPALDECAKEHNLDPFMVAGLIRQESEFNPSAKSRANAYGLTQILPSTGRQLARLNGMKVFTTGLLLQPETNIRLGTTYIRMLLDDWGGKWEETLASYNAGKGRVVNWVTWAQYREPAEFVESIPFTETREYVQAVIRNGAIYRELYGKGGAAGQAQKP